VIAKRDLGIAFGSVGNAIAKRDLGIAVLGCGGAISFGVWESDSEARPRNRFWGVGVRSLYFKALNLSIDLKPTQLTLVKKVNVYHLSRKKTHHHK
jgi:hypothetical protein